MTGEERQLYQSHTIRGEIILSEIELLKPVAGIVRRHHEQFNGRGFPDGLAGPDLPLAAQIVSAASIYDNLRNRGRRSLEEIPEDLQRIKGYQLGPEMIQLLLDHNLELLQQATPNDHSPLELDRLEMGMLLARDVRMKTGALVLAANTELSAYGIEKLRKYRELAAIPNVVFIRKSSVRK
jgi:hypothetical protein